MNVKIPDIESLSVTRFRRFGIACCYRLRCERKDPRLARALKTLERSLGPPVDEKLRRDAFNAANSAYLDLYAKGGAIAASACTLVCACSDRPNPNLLGNFKRALEEGELLDRDQIMAIEWELLRGVLEDRTA